jgi:hypothetical protein
MSASSPVLRTLAFGDLDLSVWGAGWFADPADEALTALGATGRPALLSGTRPSVEATDGEWRLDSDTASLIIAPAGEAAVLHAREEEIQGGEQLCRVTGRFAIDGTEHAVNCLGMRTWWAGPLDLDRYESIRVVASWFAEPDEGLGLIAFRARKARAHDADALAAALIAPDGATAIEDPRLSTTYEAEGWPVRAGLELWPAPSENGEQPYPRRASGEATGPRTEATAGRLDLRAEPFRWHSRGRDGAGLYILARRS